MGRFEGSGVVCDPNAPKNCATGLQRGQAAPFSGQLLSADLALNLGLKAEYCDARLTLEVDRAKALLQLDLDSERRLRAIDAEGAKAAQELLLKRLAEATPWYERPWFVASAAVLGTVAAYALAMKSADWIR